MTKVNNVCVWHRKMSAKTRGRRRRKRERKRRSRIKRIPKMKGKWKAKREMYVTQTEKYYPGVELRDVPSFDLLLYSNYSHHFLFFFFATHILLQLLISFASSSLFLSFHVQTLIQNTVGSALLVLLQQEKRKVIIWQKTRHKRRELKHNDCGRCKRWQKDESKCSQNHDLIQIFPEGIIQK